MLALPDHHREALVPQPSRSPNSGDYYVTYFWQAPRNDLNVCRRGHVSSALVIPSTLSSGIGLRSHELPTELSSRDNDLLSRRDLRRLQIVTFLSPYALTPLRLTPYALNPSLRDNDLLSRGNLPPIPNIANLPLRSHALFLILYS